MSKQRHISFKRTVTKGRTVTIPAEFKIMPDDVVEFGMLEDGTIVLVKLINPLDDMITKDVRT
jgi:hypothetical protein